MEKSAKCCCEQLSVTLLGDPEIYGVCHCNNCKRRTGSAFGVSAYFRVSQVIDMRGKANEYKHHNGHKNHDQVRHFCNTCGTTLFWYVSDMPDHIGVAGGCFTDIPLSVPSFSASAENICSWVSLNPKIKIYA